MRWEFTGFKSKKTVYLLDRAFPILGLLSLCVLGACFEHPLPASPDSPPTVQPQAAPEWSSRADSTDNSARITNLSEAMSAEYRYTADEALADILNATDDPSDRLKVTLANIRTMQEHYLESLAKNPTPPKPNEILKLPTTQKLDRSKCIQPEDKFKILNQGLRLYSDLYKHDPVNPCYIAYSRVFRDLMNVLLSGRPATLTTPDGKTASFQNLLEFYSWLQARGSHVYVVYRIYFAPFFKIYKAEGDPHLAETEVPSPLWIDAGFKTRSGLDAVIPATHSEVLFEIFDSKFGHVTEKIYYSDKGLTFDDDELMQPHWSGKRILRRFNNEEITHILQVIPALYQDFELFRSKVSGSVKLDGFGLLGVCNDGASIIVKSVTQDTLALPFPLVKTDLVKMPDEFPLRDLWQSIESDTSLRVLSLSNDERRQLLRDRILNSNAFADQGSSPFPDYDQFIHALESEEP